jgi:hypothetical protein
MESVGTSTMDLTVREGSEEQGEGRGYWRT